MSNTLQKRLKQIEQATACAICDHIEASVKRIEELAVELGLKLSEAIPPEIASTCPYCLRVKLSKVGEFNLSERALLKRFYAAWDAGTLLCGEGPTLRDELQAVFDRRARAEWGEHYTALRTLTGEQDREMERIGARLTPRRIYLCKVAGCTCSHAKTEEEWHGRMNERAA